MELLRSFRTFCSCDMFTPSVGLIPGPTLVKRRSLPAEPMDTVFSWSATESLPSATELRPLAIAPAPNAVALSPDAVESTPIALDFAPVAFAL